MDLPAKSGKKMKWLRRGIAILVAVAVLLGIARLLWKRFVEGSFYPMMGPMLVADKEIQDEKYYITAYNFVHPFEEEGWENKWVTTEFRLRCTKEIYDQVTPGEIVDIARYQSIRFMTGEVHSIREFDLEKTLERDPDYSFPKNYMDAEPGKVVS